VSTFSAYIVQCDFFYCFCSICVGLLKILHISLNFRVFICHVYLHVFCSLSFFLFLACRCDVIAAGVLNAAKNIGMKKPIIIRLKGTNVKEAKKLIEESDFQLTVTDDLEDAAKKAVAIAQIVTLAEGAKLDVSITAAV